MLLSTYHIILEIHTMEKCYFLKPIILSKTFNSLLYNMYLEGIRTLTNLTSHGHFFFFFFFEGGNVSYLDLKNYVFVNILSKGAALLFLVCPSSH